jgi:high affinity Mn2+ porin
VRSKSSSKRGWTKGACRRAMASCALAAACLGASARARAEVTEATPRADDQFDFMNLLAAHDLHDLKHERWNVYGQFTYISSWKLGFAAPYTNYGGSTNSLLPAAERSFTGSMTFYLVTRLWRGAEAQVVPEVISERALSGLRGLGGAIQNFELQKTGSESPQLYLSRIYLRQTFDLGGEHSELTSDPQQLAGSQAARRLVLTLGNFSVIDFLDKNTYSGDLRRQFLNMVFLTYSAFDFASDARGYSYGGVGELYWDDWAFRFVRGTPPQQPNQLALDFRIDKFYGDQAEIEHDHTIFGLPGAVRLLGYHNHVNAGRFDDAIAAYRHDHGQNAAACGDRYNYQSTNGTAPDLCWVRRPNDKYGIGLNVEQSLGRGIGVFVRGMYSDGQSEVYAYTSTDRSLSFGALAHGELWRRPTDVAGIGGGVNWISKVHADYLAMGGVDGFIGDGKINVSTESVFEIFYSFNVLSSIWVTADYQHIVNPAFNADRGPVDVLGARLHVEF